MRPDEELARACVAEGGLMGSLIGDPLPERLLKSVRTRESDARRHGALHDRLDPCDPARNE